MRNRETGEFEIIVGNRQLLSGFFIVALLFAVSFAMGYVVGQNSRGQAKMAANSPAPVPLASGDRPQPAMPAPVVPATDPAPATDANAAPAGGAPPSGEGSTQPTTQPARDPSAPPPPAAVAVNAAPEAPPGSFWQVMAVAQPDAEVVVRTLKDKGFPAVMSQGPNNLVRVLVGPYSDTASMGKAKTELENAGFRPIRK